jgi:hypothetical protein
MSRLNKIRLAWVVICVLLLVLYVSTYNSTTHRDNDIVLDVFMNALSFPSSYLAAMAYDHIIADHIAYNPVYRPRTEMCRDWAIFFVVGYIQWFVIVPRFFCYLAGLWKSD